MKKTLYPKTLRIDWDKVVITEKLDGSNLWIFKAWWEIYFAQRNHVLRFNELTKQNAYKWLIGWANENIKELMTLNEGSMVFWEWIWMGHLSYNLDKRFYIFAKANVDENLDAIKINYDRSLFIYPFENQNIPDCMWVVKKIEETSAVPSISYLDELYETYSKKEWRNIEWFIIIYWWGVKKYVRMKDGNLSKHKTYK